jgi:antitoxin component YwqK of YwqJK toxin-antitoxin module
MRHAVLLRVLAAPGHLWHHESMTCSEAERAPELEPFEKLHKDGSLWARGFTLEGEIHGDWEWFRIDGTLMRSGSPDRGRQVGIWTTYDKAGIPYKDTDCGE